MDFFYYTPKHHHLQLNTPQIYKSCGDFYQKVTPTNLIYHYSRYLINRRIILFLFFRLPVGHTALLSIYLHLFIKSNINLIIGTFN